MSPASAPPEVEVLGRPNCTTCQKVLKELKDRGVQVRRFRDLKEEPLTPSEVRSIAGRVGGVERLFSRRALKYRSLGLHQRKLSESDLADWMVKEYTFVTRPVVLSLRSTSAFCGGSKKTLEAWLRAEAPAREG